MKKLTLVASMLLTFGAMAAEVKVTSFVLASSQTRLAELCGVASGHGDHAHIRILVDPGTNKPGSYNTIAGKDGKFCAVVLTYTGRADVSIFDGESQPAILSK